eukprot:403351982
MQRIKIHWLMQQMACISLNQLLREDQIDGKASVTKQLDGKMNKEPEEEKKGSENLNVENVQAASSDSGADCLASYESFVAELGDWQECLKDYLSKPGFRSVYDFVKSEYEKSSVPIYPPKHLIFNAFKNTQFKDLKVVLVGQDPYIKKDEAMGLCFSIPKHVKVPPSLKNIYKALENDPKVQFKTPAPIHGDLSAWAQQGVLMLNAILTVKEAISNSHQKKGWEQFTDAVIQAINQKADGVVFVLWGGKAQDKASSVNANKQVFYSKQITNLIYLNIKLKSKLFIDIVY